MNVESVIYSYIFVCTGLVLFCLVLFPVRWIQGRQHKQRSAREKINLINAVKAVEAEEMPRLNERQIKRLVHRLKKSKNLIAFVESAEQMPEAGEMNAQRYLFSLAPVFAQLCRQYFRKGLYEATYFAYAIGVVLRGMPDVPKEIFDFLEMRIRSSSIYCRQNALSALHALGDLEHAVSGLLLLNRLFPEENAKLITESMLRFSGDKSALGNAMFDVYERLGGNMRLALLNFIRQSDSSFGSRMLSILRDETADDELRFSAIRYFGKYRYEEVRSLLQDHVKSEGTFAAVSATALSNHPGEDTFLVLKEALDSHDWYVRLNASGSMEALGLDYQKVSDILNGDDRFAREMLEYRIRKAASTAAGE